MVNKIFVNGNRVTIFNPTLDMLPEIKRVHPGFKIESSMHPQDFEPLFQKSRMDGSLEYKLERAARSMKSCQFCGLNCKTDRYRGYGKCGLSIDVSYSAPFTIISEEKSINPAICFYFSERCCMDCIYCFMREDIDREYLPFNTSDIWNQVNNLLENGVEINAFEFSGGEPVIYLPWILEMLKNAPENFRLPVLLNCSLYLSPFALELLDNVIDIYLPDFRYPTDRDAKIFSGIENYWDTATKTIERMAGQRARVIVRILVLPNLKYERIFRFLSGFRDRLWVSVLDQYIPLHQAHKFPEISRTPTDEEIAEVKRLVKRYDLRDINENPEGFWRD